MKYNILSHAFENSLFLEERKNYQILQECSLIIHVLDEH